MKAAICKIFAVVLAATMIFGIVPWRASAAETTATFTVATLNVDGLPQKILGLFDLNGDGPGKDGTTAISKKIATTGWDLLAVSENFNYNTQLMSALTEYKSGTHRGSISGLSNDTDGLNLIWKNSITVSGEKWTAWKDYYSSGILGTGNGADSMIDKGYRYYQATMAEGVNVDVYILHMDAASDEEDIAAREKQMNQLVTAIKASNNGNPIIIMGDTNSRYTRENLKTILIDGIDADERFTIQDAWVEKVRNGDYPGYGDHNLVADDKYSADDEKAGSVRCFYPEAEIVDKIFYINNTDSAITLEAKSYTIAQDFTYDNGNPLADHWPVVVEFEYHNYQETARTEAGCEADGQIIYTCIYCDASDPEVIPAVGHNYLQTEQADAGCESDGHITYTCANCSDSYVEMIPAVSHNYLQTERADAGCEADGHITYTCANCSDSYMEMIPAVGHSYQETERVAAGCEADGHVTYTCTNCGGSYRETLAAVGHTWDNGVNTGADIVFTCTACDAEKTKVLKAPTVSLNVSKNSSGKIVMKGIVDDYENLEDYYTITAHGLVYIQSSKIGSRTLTVNTSGRTRVNFGAYNEDGSFSYSFTPSKTSTAYTIRAFISYLDPATDKTVTVYSSVVKGSYNTFN